MYEVLYEITPWTLENVTSFDELYKKVIIDKQTPKIPDKKGI
jgi:hypothetical protein